MGLFDFLDPPVQSAVQVPTMSQAPSNVFSYDPSQIYPTQTSLLGGIGGLSQYNLGGTNLQQAQGIGQGMISDPGAAFYTGAAPGGASLGMRAAMNQFGAGGGIYGAAFDPQNDLYNRLMAQTTDRARANASAAGLGTTPLGALSTSLAQNDANMQWQNQQLQRYIQGSQAASGLQAGAAPLWMQSAAYPWQTGQQIGGAGLGTLSSLGQLGIQASQIPGMQIGGWQQSIPTMAGLQSMANAQQQQQFADASTIAQLQLAKEKQAFQEQQGIMGGLGKTIGTLGGAGIGFMLGGPMGAMAGASLGGSLGGGLGGGGGSSGGGNNAWSTLSNSQGYWGPTGFSGYMGNMFNPSMGSGGVGLGSGMGTGMLY